MKSMDLDKKQIGRLGEDLVKKYLEDKGFYVERGFGKDLRVYRSKPKDRLKGYFSCEVKTTLKQKYVHLPRKNQERDNDLLAQVKLLEVMYNAVSFKIRFKPLGEISLGNLSFDWERVSYGGR